MTPEDWKKAESLLVDRLFGRVELKIDGYEISLRIERADALKSVIVVYIDGWFRGGFITKDCEERLRFMCPRTKNVWSSETRKVSKREKKALKKAGLDLDQKITFYEPFWTSFRSLKRHLIANNESIELIQEEEKTAECK